MLLLLPRRRVFSFFIIYFFSIQIQKLGLFFVGGGNGWFDTLLDGSVALTLCYLYLFSIEETSIRNVYTLLSVVARVQFYSTKSLAPDFAKC